MSSNIPRAFMVALALAGCGGSVDATNQPGVHDAGVGGGAGSGGAGGTGGTGGSAGVGGSAQGGQAGAGGAAGADAGPGCNCGSLEECYLGKLCVARSVTLPAGFSVDATEVTRAQYAAWVASDLPKPPVTSTCGWNTSLEADPTCMSGQDVCKGADCGAHPQVCMDECDAQTYCSAVGKHLCAAIGGGEVHLQNDATKSQWYNACTSGGMNDFTYGDSPASGTCNDYLTFTTTTVPVASKTECHSWVAGYEGVYDLIGNVWEWEQNCSTSQGADDICHPRGFSFGMGAAMPMCSGDDYAKRADVRSNLGFRCCK